MRKALTRSLAVCVAITALTVQSNCVLADESDPAYTPYYRIELPPLPQTPIADDKNPGNPNPAPAGNPQPQVAVLGKAVGCRSLPFYEVEYYLGCFVELGATSIFYLPHEVSEVECREVCLKLAK